MASTLRTKKDPAQLRTEVTTLDQQVLRILARADWRSRTEVRFGYALALPRQAQIGFDDLLDAVFRLNEFASLSVDSYKLLQDEIKQKVRGHSLIARSYVLGNMLRPFYDKGNFSSLLEKIDFHVRLSSYPEGSTFVGPQILVAPYGIFVGVDYKFYIKEICEEMYQDTLPPHRDLLARFPSRRIKRGNYDLIKNHGIVVSRGFGGELLPSTTQLIAALYFYPHKHYTAPTVSSEGNTGDCVKKAWDVVLSAEQDLLRIITAYVMAGQEFNDKSILKHLPLPQPDNLDDYLKTLLPTFLASAKYDMAHGNYETDPSIMRAKTYVGEMRVKLRSLIKAIDHCKERYLPKEKGMVLYDFRTLREAGIHFEPVLNKVHGYLEQPRFGHIVDDLRKPNFIF
ncbi:hypothetical protein HYY69_01325 [Candidatus Woesearchaeota archaeon]|nr:hypothetical protein [Candidatus Woesearchaeota archaeon]